MIDKEFNEFIEKWCPVKTMIDRIIDKNTKDIREEFEKDTRKLVEKKEKEYSDG